MRTPSLPSWAKFIVYATHTTFYASSITTAISFQRFHGGKIVPVDE